MKASKPAWHRIGPRKFVGPQKIACSICGLIMSPNARTRASHERVHEADYLYFDRESSDDSLDAMLGREKRPSWRSRFVRRKENIPVDDGR